MVISLNYFTANTICFLPYAGLTSIGDKYRPVFFYGISVSRGIIEIAYESCFKSYFTCFICGCNSPNRVNRPVRPTGRVRGIVSSEGEITACLLFIKLSAIRILIIEASIIIPISIHTLNFYHPASYRYGYIPRYYSREICYGYIKIFIHYGYITTIAHPRRHLIYECRFSYILCGVAFFVYPA